MLNIMVCSYGDFQLYIYNKLIVQNLVENPHKGQMKRVMKMTEIAKSLRLKHASP